MKTGLKQISERVAHIKKYGIGESENLADSFKTLAHGDVWWHNNAMETRNLHELVNAGALIAMEIDRIESEIEIRGFKHRPLSSVIEIDRFSGLR